MSKSVPRGEKFTDKYDVSTATIYKGNPESLRIPPPGHPLYDATSPVEPDEMMIAAVDRDGLMNTPIEVWTDPDEGILWVLDGRRRYRAVQEVNARRAKDGREPVEPHITPFTRKNGRPTLADAVARVREKNYHRRIPTPSGMAVDLLAMRNAGCSWQQCVDALHVRSTDPEQWGRKLLPLGRCEPEVRAAVDDKKIPRSAAVRFGGKAQDGSDALGRNGQLDLLAKMLAAKSAPKSDKVNDSDAKVRSMNRVTRTRIAMSLANGVTKGLPPAELAIARAIAAYERFATEGNETALDYLPTIKQIIVQARQAPAHEPSTNPDDE